MKRTCDELGVCNGHGNCPGCVRPDGNKHQGQATTPPAGGGNFWLTDEDEAQDLTAADVLKMIFWLCLVVAAVATAAGYVTGLVLP